MNNEKKYDTMSKQQLVQLCCDKDLMINYFKNKHNMLCKKDIMDIYNCENGKALGILKIIFQMGYGNKIGKEYYVSVDAHKKFIENMRGKEVFI